MTDIIDKNYTNKQIERATNLFNTLVFKTRYRGKDNFYMTGRGDKTKEGLINTILDIMYVKRR